MIQRRKRLKSGAPPKRYVYPPRSLKPIAKEGPAKARRRKEYERFMRSPAWKQIRAQKLAESPTCEMGHPGCLLNEQLTVHHLTYARFGGKERMSDLQTGCRPCHNYTEALKGKRINVARK